ncbi:hypothetical protein J7394_15300 [Ruegeria sp. R13_0]|uniref:hypothetical protein n=1 Tax=Ruegeria sp. R13_0 TaxID=2821099 RepID=UPI001ADBED12|nr:hypothetical protein [Ruegeria sp. R13_0]MBO9435585.1 hypothetical protein [Ruegeria sp. R13_0]
MKKMFRTFRASEEGAVTVDWVVLTALIIGLATLLYFAIQTATIGLSGNTSQALSSATISTGTSTGGGGGIATEGTAGGN